ncbi:hematopoietic SH2 domain-containing protein homolog isoform X2 [Entelurus aequoreus]|uniref:hematopoietic SH2 domain-containing protein homolog isoform X2 n=1 Tax=Entelurus aequoreus TaxID=161455 RepID=UPI002B1E4CE5|nr:hematopoietic SH2 domain-containing protein homolog isoform X2 [Entelurus aequoreus]
MSDLTQLSHRHNNDLGNTAPQLTWMDNGVVPEWFHGGITRKSAEDLLTSKLPGCFLVRVSESRVGYTLSYRAQKRCRHFMIETKGDSFAIVGEHRSHPGLQQLVDFHRKVPIAPYTEVLMTSCGQTWSGGNIEKNLDNCKQIPQAAEEVNPPQDEVRSQTLPVKPVPKSRKRYTTDKKPPPETTHTPADAAPAPPCEKPPAVKSEELGAASLSGRQ